MTKNYVASITSAIQAAPSTTTSPDGKTKNQYGTAFDALAAEFPDDFYQLDTAALFDFSSSDPLDRIQKRDNNVIGFPACSTPNTNTALPTDFPKLFTTSTSASSSSSPTSAFPQPPSYTGETRPNFQLQCTDKSKDGFKSLDRRIAMNAINVGCGSGAIKSGRSPVDNFNISQTGYQDGDHSKPSQYVHMVHKWSANQDGCQPMVADWVTVQNSNCGISQDNCQKAMMYILDDCKFLIPPNSKVHTNDHQGDTDTVTEKYGGAVRRNAPNGCIDLNLWSPDGPDLAPM